MKVILVTLYFVFAFGFPSPKWLYCDRTYSQQWFHGDAGTLHPSHNRTVCLGVSLRTPYFPKLPQAKRLMFEKLGNSGNLLEIAECTKDSTKWVFNGRCFCVENFPEKCISEGSAFSALTEGPCTVSSPSLTYSKQENSFIFTNFGGKFCLDSMLSPPLPYTCSTGSPSFLLPFCNASLSHEDRVEDFLGRLNLQSKIESFVMMNPGIPYDPVLNIKQIFWDATCIHGIAGNVVPVLNVTVFPHAINLGASFDVKLVRKIGAATAIEARIINHINYLNTKGQTFQGISCDGGPLANSVHDARWGRVSETYGEDPHVISVIGTEHVKALQNKSRATKNGYFVQTSQVTRHFLGFHGAVPDLPNEGEETIDPQWMEDQQLPIFRSFQTEGQAEGIMCAMNTLNGIPSCVHPFLIDTLRNEWNSTSFLQTDCCDSITLMVTPHHFFPNLVDAVVASIFSGVQGAYSWQPDKISDALSEGISKNLISEKQLMKAIRRTYLNRFRLGEFDTENPSNPFRGNYDPSLLDGEKHRSLARYTAAASTVLLENRNRLIPIDPTKLSGMKKVAVIGPFADCTDTSGGYFGNKCYLHSYNGQASHISTYFSALKENFAKISSDISVEYSIGSNPTSPVPKGIENATALAKNSDLVFLVLGLGTEIEAEGIDRWNFSFPIIQETLFSEISSVVPPEKIVLIIVSAGGVDFDTKMSDTILQVWYAGEEAGNGAADVIFGRVPPSARLPITFYKNEYLNLVNPISDFNLISNGTGRTYRYYDGPHILYRFGYGLSTTTFFYKNLNVAKNSNGTVSVRFSVENVGPIESDEITQVYVTVPKIHGVATPKFSLKWFSKEFLRRKNPKHISLEIRPEDYTTVLSDGTRVISAGNYIVWVGGHLPSDTHPDLPSNMLSATFSV